MAQALDKYRINPGNVGTGRRRDEQFATICAVAREHGKAVRIGVNGGSLNQELVLAKMQENTDRDLGTKLRGDPERVHGALGAAVDGAGPRVRPSRGADRHLLQGRRARCDLISLYRDLAAKTVQPLHLGLTEAGMGTKGLVWSSAAMGVLLAEGIGDTIRVSLTPRPGGDRREEVYAACELLQSLGLRAFAPSVTACPGCGRTTSSTFQELAERIQGYVRGEDAGLEGRARGGRDDDARRHGLHRQRPGRVEGGRASASSLPGTGEAPSCPVYVDGQKFTTLKGSYEELSAAFRALVDDYVATKYPRRERWKRGPYDAAGAAAPDRDNLHAK